MLLLLLVNQGLILLGFGVVGEYIGRIYLETKRRPLYIVDDGARLADGGGGNGSLEARLPELVVPESLLPPTQ